jgi:3-carboxy-cis,cis-muconate cycloisomerase
MLELRAGLDALITDLNTAIDGFTLIAGRHRRTAAVARTSLQHALPMPFGLKLAGYAAALARSRERLRRLRKEGLALQFGGVAGTLASLGENGLAVTDRLAALLDLPAPDAPWHAHSDRLAEIASALAILTGTCGKIARDVALMMQTEVGEAHEPPRGHIGEAVGRRRPASRPRPSRRTCSPPSSPARCRSTSAASAAGRRSGMPCRRCCSSPPARSPPSPRSRRGSRPMRSACAATSTSARA